METLMLTLASLLVTAAVATPRQLPPELDAYIESAVQRTNVPGLAIAVVDEHGLVAAKGYGVRRLGAPERVDGDTHFDTASLTKSFTAAVLAILVDEGKLCWDDGDSDGKSRNVRPLPRRLDVGVELGRKLARSG